MHPDRPQPAPGRRNAIAAAYLDAATRAREPHTEYADAARAKRTKLERDLFAIPGNGDHADS